MSRLLLLGYDPETVDFSDPALPPGMTVQKVHAGIAVALKQFAERGWESDVCLEDDDQRPVWRCAAPWCGRPMLMETREAPRGGEGT
jgi:hypothetical protein